MDTYRVNKGDSEQSINSVNQWMRSQPWYQEQLAQWGQNPNNVHLSKSQGHQIVKLAQANGAQIDEGGIEVDPGGNFNPIGHKLRNVAIGIGLGGAAALTGGAALGAFGGAGAAGGAGGMAGLMGAGSVVPGAALGAGGGLAGLGAGAAAGVGGLGGLMGAGSVVPGAALGAGGGVGGAAGAGGGILGTLKRMSGGLSDAGNALSQGASANASGRREDSLADMNAATANNRARVETGEFNIAAPVTRAQQAAKGDLMAANIPNASFSGSGRNLQLSGGLSPSLFGPDTTAAGNALKKDALTALLNGSDHIDPQITAPRRAGAGENIMAGAGMGLNLLGSLGRLAGR